MLHTSRLRNMLLLRAAKMLRAYLLSRLRLLVSIYSDAVGVELVGHLFLLNTLGRFNIRVHRARLQRTLSL